jgi:hypothetical protein
MTGVTPQAAGPVQTDRRVTVGAQCVRHSSIGSDPEYRFNRFEHPEIHRRRPSGFAWIVGGASRPQPAKIPPEPR